MSISGYEETDRQKKIDEKFAEQLGVSAYLWKNVRAVSLALGGGFLGYHGGKLVAGMGHLNGKNITLFNRISSLTDRFEAITIPAASASKYIGMYVGAQVGALFSTYDMWRKREGAQLAVQELTEDMSNMAAIRAKTDPDLVNEMDSLRGMYDGLKQENASLREKIGEPKKPGASTIERGERSATDHAEQAEAATEAAR